MKKIATAYTEFQPLLDVMVGRCFDSRIVDTNIFPDYLNNGEKLSKGAKRLFKDLFDETEEDFQNLSKLLNDFGANVYRPSYNDVEWFRRKSLAPILMNPRDLNMTIDNQIVHSYKGAMKNDKSPFLTKIANDFDNVYQEPFIDKDKKEFVFSSIVRLGDTIILDSNEFANSPDHVTKMAERFEHLGYRIKSLETHNFKFANEISHGDAVFAILKPGLIIYAGGSKIDGLRELYPGWDVIQVSNSGNKNQKKWLERKEKVRAGDGNVFFSFHNNKYWSQEFVDLVDNWATEWMPYSLETFFDLNCLVVDEENVIFSNYNKKLFNTLEKYNVNCHISKFRHRYFWDGGIHCITWDINRKGNKEVYI
jgi:N-dimethylarginine dimethylaminohydrolase